MSAYSTLHITRSRARAELLRFVLEATNEQLGDMLDEKLRPHLYNCRVVPDGTQNDDERIP